MLASLLRASLTGALGVVLVWVLCRLIPRLSAATRATLWWCVAAKFVVALVWFAPVKLPILPAAPPMRLWAGPMRSGVPTTVVPGLVTVTIVTNAVNQIAWPFVHRPIASPRVVAGWMNGANWSRRSSVAVLTAWMLGLLVIFILGVRRWRQAAALVAHSTDASDQVRALVTEVCARVSLRGRRPDARVSNEVETPMVVGLRHPVILVPEGEFARLSTEQQQMALCHEIAHVRRYDLRLGSLAALAEALFFFHPFAKLATSEYSLAREAACDAAVLEALDTPPHEYAQLLLTWGPAPKLGLSAASMSSACAQMRRRLTMLGNEAATASRAPLLKAVACVVLILAMVPIQLTVRSSAPFPRTGSLVFRQRQRTGHFKRSGENLLWVRWDGREYLVRDPASVRVAESLMAEGNRAQFDASERRPRVIVETIPTQIR